MGTVARLPCFLLTWRALHLFPIGTLLAPRIRRTVSNRSSALQLKHLRETPVSGAQTGMPAGCTADDLTTFPECTAALVEPAATADTQAQCDYMKGTMACYPKCYCDDATTKAAFDEGAKQVKDAMDCTITCGAAGLRASVLTGILAAFVAIFAAK